MCNKKGFATGDQARRAAIVLEGRGRDNKKSFFYRCDDCGLFHLTTRNIKEKQKSQIRRREQRELKRIDNEILQYVNK